jgi:hypothetical protein
LQAQEHPVIEFVESEEEVAAAHHRVEGMNFIPGGYTYKDWGAGDGTDGRGSGGGVGGGAGTSHAHDTRFSAGGDAGGQSSMSVDLQNAPRSETVVRLSPDRQLRVTPPGGLGGPPTGQDAPSAMDHDGVESSPSHASRLRSELSPSPPPMAAPVSSVQTPGSKGMSNETPTGLAGGIREMEALTLQPPAGSSDVGAQHSAVQTIPERPPGDVMAQDARVHGEADRAPVHPEAEEVPAPPLPRPSSAGKSVKGKGGKGGSTSAGLAVKERVEASKRTQKGVSPGRITEEADIPHPTAADSPQGSLSPPRSGRRLNTVPVQKKG